MRKAVFISNHVIPAFCISLCCLAFFNQSCSAEDDLWVIGTPQSHKTLWENDEAGSDQRRNNYNIRSDNVQKIDELQKRIADISTHLDDELDLNKDEFETTNEWVARKAETSKSHKADMASEIKSCKQQIEDLKRQNDSLSIPSDSLKLPKEVIFVVKVRMGNYDADNGTIDKFEKFTLEGTDGCVKVDDSDRIFNFEGVTDFNNLAVSREKAKALRDASNRGYLWIGIKARPTTLQFSDHYLAKNVTYQVETTPHASQTISSGQTIAARLIVSALGGDPGAIDELKPQRTFRTEKGDVERSGKIITTGWEGTAKPLGFFFYDESTGRLKPIQEDGSH